MLLGLLDPDSDSLVGGKDPALDLSVIKHLKTSAGKRRRTLYRILRYSHLQPSMR
jgi:hypothetical protein